MYLTDSQQRVIKHKDSPLLVTAGPGSGKTRVLVEKTINLIESGKKKVLALTFSNKAAEEILERLKSRLSSDQIEYVNVGTFHSFCLELILDRGNMIGLPASLNVIESEKDKIELLKKVINESGSQEMYSFSPQEILNKISKVKQRFEYPFEENRDFKFIFESYNNLMLEQRLVDYDDILFYAYRLLNEKPQVAHMYNRIYKTVFVDEAQDLNEAQYNIIFSLCRNLQNTILIGDEKQSIYGFNGSSSHYMMERFFKDFNPQRIEMKENFRSTHQIIKASQGIKNNQDNIGVYPLRGEVCIVKQTNEYLEAEWVSRKIAEQIAKGNQWIEGQINFENIAILGRNRYVFQEIEKNFKINKIPYNFRSNMKLLESATPEMQLFENGLKFITNPYNQIIKRNLSDFLLFDENLIENHESYLLSAKLINEKEISLRVFNNIIRAWKIILGDNELFMQGLIEIEKVVHDIKNDNCANQSLELLMKDIDMWKTHWRQYCTLVVTGKRNLSHFKNQIALGKTTNYNQEGVTLSTIHMAKGLEYDIVFIVGMCEGVFPDYRASNTDQLEEEKNNMFVALTRAKRVCYLSYPEYRKMPWGKEKKQYPSRYLRDIENALNN